MTQTKPFLRELDLPENINKTGAEIIVNKSLSKSLEKLKGKTFTSSKIEGIIRKDRILIDWQDVLEEFGIEEK